MSNEIVGNFKNVEIIENAENIMYAEIFKEFWNIENFEIVENVEKKENVEI